jgi:nitrogen fixation protein FixH
MSPTILPVARRQQGLQGRHVAIIFFTFFGTIFAMNGAMIYSAFSTYSGIVSNEPYRKGLNYNDRIAADARQARLGWNDAITVGRDGHVVVMLADRDGQPIAGARLDAQIGRPSTNRHDIKIDLGETAAGRYEAQVGTLDEGSWTISVDVKTTDGGVEPVYRARRRLWLKH